MALYVPILGRLSLADYQRLILTGLIMLSEALVRFILFIVPAPFSAFVDWWRFKVVGWVMWWNR
jgi:hypothetical protein